MTGSVDKLRLPVVAFGRVGAPEDHPRWDGERILPYGEPVPEHDGSPSAAPAKVYTADDLATAAREVATLTALLLIRESGDAEAAIEGAASFSIPVEGDEVLDAAGIAALAIRDALNMGVTSRA